MKERTLFLLLALATLVLVTPRLRAADEIETFAHLRSLAFDRDLDFANEYAYFHARDPRGLAGFKATFLDKREPLTGRHINFTPVGTAVLWAPFFGAAHLAVLAARALGAAVPADGFSRPYEAAVCYASAFYGLFGLVLLHDALARFGGYSARASAFTVGALWLGTPVLYYMTIAPGFAHAASLYAVALLVWLSLRASRTDAPAAWALAGAAGGLAGLVREQDVLFLAVPAVLLLLRAWKTRDAGGLVSRAALLGGASVLVFLPQLFVYRAITGRFGPSPLVARKMTYTSPHFLEVLFDPGHGLFVWTPLLLLATAGLVAAAARRRPAALGLLAALVLQVWINGSIESWTQAGAFGSRRFVAATPAFAWGLATLVESALPRLRGAGVAAALALFAWWNLSLMVQFGLRLMDRQRLEWPRVAVNQFVEVPPRLGRAGLLFLTDRERLVRETR